MKYIDRDLLLRRAAAYMKQSNFYAARAHEAHHTAVAAEYFRQEAEHLRQQAAYADRPLLLLEVDR